MSALLGVTVPECRKLLSERSEQGRAFREDRITEREFWDEVFRLAGQPTGSRPADGLLSRLWAETYKLNTAVAELLRRVRERASVGVITNIDRARSKYLEDVIGINGLVDVYLPSCRFGITKGQPGFWDVMTSEVRRALGRGILTYVDDRSEHVAAAIAAGWAGIRFTGLASLEDELTRRELL